MTFNTIAFWRGENGFYDGSWARFVFSFPDRDSADTLYRGLHEYSSGSKAVITELSRLSPQMWTWQTKPNNAFAFEGLIRSIYKGEANVIGDNDYLERSRGKSSIMRLNDDGGRNFWPILPPYIDDIKDHIHGGTFHIRSTRDRSQYWWDAGKRVEVSKEKRSVFKIEIENSPELKGPIVFTGKDQVKLSVFRAGRFHHVLIDESRQLTASNTWGRKLVFNFEELKTAFELVYDEDVGYPTYNEDNAELRVGETWELC
ncbi:hypothetical protein N7501_002919 [Penicillium viridicatum]|nr:hypothetical protein N7501_002919 [Penicillium viridicatum]